jgi:hypothetical protein
VEAHQRARGQQLTVLVELSREDISQRLRAESAFSAVFGEYVGVTFRAIETDRKEQRDVQQPTVWVAGPHCSRARGKFGPRYSAHFVMIEGDWKVGWREWKRRRESNVRRNALKIFASIERAILLIHVILLVSELSYTSNE